MKIVQVNFGTFKEYDVNNRFFNPNLAGGALLDIGVYAVSFARWFMTSKPNTVLTTMTPLETGVDESSGILLQNKGIEIAMISLTMRAKQPKEALWLVKTDILGCIIFLELKRRQSHIQVMDIR